MAFRHGFEVRQGLEQPTSVAEVLEKKHSSRRVNLSRQSIKHRIILRRKKKREKTTEEAIPASCEMSDFENGAIGNP